MKTAKSKPFTTQKKGGHTSKGKRYAQGELFAKNNAPREAFASRGLLLKGNYNDVSLKRYDIRLTPHDIFADANMI